MSVKLLHRHSPASRPIHRGTWVRLFAANGGLGPCSPQLRSSPAPSVADHPEFHLDPAVSFTKWHLVRMLPRNPSGMRLGGTEMDMPNGFDGRCFISGEDVSRAQLGSAEYIEIVSPTYGPYRVMKSAIAGLRALDADARLSAFNKAQAVALTIGDKVPMITAEQLEA